MENAIVRKSMGGMTKKGLATGLAAIAALVVGVAPAYAGQNAVGASFSSAAPGTVGPGISGDIYGNTSNPSGKGEGVLPSLSPGPWACNYPDCSSPTLAGGSMGDFISPIASDGRSNSNFANDKDPGPDFS